MPVRFHGISIVFYVADIDRTEKFYSGHLGVEFTRNTEEDGSVWLLSSSEAVAHLAEALPDQHWGAAHALATHPRIAEAARAAGFGTVRECRPALEDVVASIESAA